MPNTDISAENSTLLETSLKDLLDKVQNLSHSHFPLGSYLFRKIHQNKRRLESVRGKIERL